MTQEEHKKLGIDLFNATWDLIDRNDRTPAQNLEMIHAAHASAYHWIKAGGTALNQARSQWQISRVYAILGMGNPALFHAERSLSLCTDNGIGGFDLAFGYEAVARAHWVLGRSAETEENKAAALAACEAVTDADDRTYVQKEINSIA